MLTLQALIYIEENDRTSRPIWNYTPGTLTSGKGAKADHITKHNCGEVRKQPEHGRTSATEEQK